jgi:hypothetical protein
MRAFRFLLACFFLMIAFYETDGRDPLIWIAAAGIMALLSVMSIFRFYLRKALWVVCASWLVALIIYIPFISDYFTRNLSTASWWMDDQLRYLLYMAAGLIVSIYFLWDAYFYSAAFNRLRRRS